jgi:hypothetical protein
MRTLYDSDTVRQLQRVDLLKRIIEGAKAGVIAYQELVSKIIVDAIFLVKSDSDKKFYKIGRSNYRSSVFFYNYCGVYLLDIDVNDIKPYDYDLLIVTLDENRYKYK